MSNIAVGTTLNSGNRHLLFKRLLLLRSAMLVSVLAAVVVTQAFQYFQLDHAPLLAGIGVGAVVSLYSWFRVYKKTNIGDWRLAKQLLLDIALLTFFVWFSGRSTNPFIYYLLVIVAISASIFSSRISWAFSIGCVAIYTVLMYIDFNEHLHHMTQDFQLHLVGMWLNFVGSALLISFFVSRLATALRDRQIQLAAAREETLKNEQLIGIGTLAASTVHSLGSPLSTLAVSVEELKGDLPEDERNQYLDLMLAQIERCKSTMGKLSLLANNEQSGEQSEAFGELMRDIKEYFQLTNASPMPNMLYNKELEQLHLPYNFLLRHALINLIDNAVQAAKSRVVVDSVVTNGQLIVTIEDDGEGVPAEILDGWGKPVKSTKEQGLGIGVFLANSTIEKLGGQVKLYSADKERSTTKLIVELPLVGGADENR